MLNLFELKTLRGFLRDVRDLISDALHLTKETTTTTAPRVSSVLHSSSLRKSALPIVI
jgi:hypothetical protein